MTTPLDHFDAFISEVRQCLENNHVVEVTQPAVERPNDDLIAEVQQKLADVCGCSACLWVPLERLRERARGLEQPRRMTGPDRAKLEDPEPRTVGPDLSPLPLRFF